jgi:hypothetical protein
MKQFALAASLVLTAGAAFAQAPAPAPVVANYGNIAKPTCTKAEFPGRLAMTQSDSRRKLFEREFKAYSDCMKGYVDERAVAARANQEAANAAITEYNEFAKKINAEREAMKD